MKREKQSTEIVETTTRLEFTGKDIIRMLKSEGDFIPEDAKVFVTIPGGGSLSYTDLSIDEETPLVMKWTTTRTKRQ